MSATPEGESPRNEEDALLHSDIPINQLTARQLDQLTATVLRERGWEDYAAIVESKSGGLVSGIQAQPTISSQEFVNRHVPRGGSMKAENVYDRPDVVARLHGSLSGAAGGTSKAPVPNNNLTSMKEGSSSQLLMGDPLNRQEAFRDLQAWVEGSLDMYKVRDQCMDN